MPIHSAAFSGHQPVVQYFLTRGVDPRSTTSGRATLLHTAARGGSLATVRYLVEEVGVSFKKKAKKGEQNVK